MENDTNIVTNSGSKKKKIIYAAILIIIATNLVLFASKYESASSVATTTPETQQKNEQSVQDNEIKNSPTKQTLPFSNSPGDIAWAVFQKYLGFNKDQDLNSVKSIVYKISPICANTASTTECFSRMNLAYQYGSEMKKEDFVNVWSDEKQIILATDFWTESSEEMDAYGRFRSIIFFIKGDDGKWKLLSFSPTKGGAVNKGNASQEEIDQRLVRYTEDKDNDGLADYNEECLSAENQSSCVKTSPSLRDTDSDGLWDGIEALMN